MAEPQERERGIPVPSTALRTMQSDVSEYLRTAKPTLVTLLARQAALGSRGAPEVRRHTTRTTVAVAAIAGVLFIGGIFGYLFLSSIAPPAPPLPVPPTASFVTADTTAEIAVERTQELLALITRAAAAPQAPGSFLRLVIQMRAVGEARSPLGFRQLFAATGGTAPAFVDNLTGTPQFYLYAGQTGPRLVVMVEATNPARAFASLYETESSLAHDLGFLFLGSPPPFSIAVFEDRTYRNIDFRYLPLEGTLGRGIAYLQYPAKRLIIMATSEEAANLTIDRLLPNR